MKRLINTLLLIGLLGVLIMAGTGCKSLPGNSLSNDSTTAKTNSSLELAPAPVPATALSAPVTTLPVSEPASSALDIQYYFPRAGQHPDQELIKVINSTNKQLDIAIYSLTEKDIVDSIVASKNRGASVRIITDSQEAKSKSEALQLSVLKKAGIPIKINSHKGLMYLKVTIADKKIVTTGSYNYTAAAAHDNDEVLVVIQDPTMAQDWGNEFNAMWNDDKNYKEYK